MESDSNYGGSSSSRIQNLVEDLGDESFETRNEALMTLKAMLPHSEVSISNNLVEIIADHGDNELEVVLPLLTKELLNYSKA